MVWKSKTIEKVPPYEKNKLLLNEYLGDFMHIETLFLFFFSVEMGFFEPLPKGRVQKKKYGIFHTLVGWLGFKKSISTKKYGLKMHKIT